MQLSLHNRLTTFSLAGLALALLAAALGLMAWRPGVRLWSPQTLSGVNRLPPDARLAIARLLNAEDATLPALSIESLAWIERAKLTASDGAQLAVFGSAIAMSGDTIVVGAGGDSADQGAAYVFTKPAGGWATLTETAKLTASDGVAEDWFGYSLAIEGDTIVVGAVGGTYGTSTKPGSAYVFVKPGGGWVSMTQTAKLTASDGVANDQFGHATAINGDTIAVGAPFASSTYVFVKPGGGWITATQTAKLTSTVNPLIERAGMAVALRDDTLIVGAVGISATTDAAYVFVRPGGGWITTTQTAALTASDGVTGDNFGWSIGFDGTTAVIGASSDAIGANNQQGSAYVFVKPGGGWITTTQTAKLTASDGAAIDWFGQSVALSADRVAVGAVLDNVDANGDQGSVYIFDKPGGGWTDMTETTKLTASDGETHDGLGWSVALEGGTLVAGAYIDDGVAANQGSAYVFALADVVYLPLLTR